MYLCIMDEVEIIQFLVLCGVGVVVGGWRWGVAVVSGIIRIERISSRGMGIEYSVHRQQQSLQVQQSDVVGGYLIQPREMPLKDSPWHLLISRLAK